METTNQTSQTMQQEVSFTKENDGLWYVDRPDFIELGYGTKGNLLMVAGADTLLDALLSQAENPIIHNGHQTISMMISLQPQAGFECIEKVSDGFDLETLRQYNHPVVESGANYILRSNGHKLWLCPTLLYVIRQNTYPNEIYFKLNNN
jgi:hypothetical protein